ncbi:hypothetical protein Zm00014a_025975 [Zea mays]|uniref:Uncharacterized protein n=1 Tax=Zea mays TaxID=4577 RepID=A0A3L6G8B0_MAIZE|nr:hypothetical protein Zm00014a_025975 [Zea mays]
MEEDPAGGEDLSSTAASSRHSYSGDDGEESGWTSYIDYFMETQQRRRRRKQGDVSRAAGDGPSTDDDAGRRRSSTAECSSGAGVGASSSCLPPPVLVDPPVVVVSRRLSLREGWRRKKVLHDESLEDTATSPISSPKRKNSTGGDVNNGANTRTDHTAAVKEDSAAYGNDEEISRPLLGPAYACFSCIADDDANKFIGC